VSLLHENQSTESGILNEESCPHFFNCIKQHCAAHSNTNLNCWLVSQTHCRSNIPKDFVEKFATCLACEYFKKQGSLHPKGLNFFIAEQLQNYNKNNFEPTLQNLQEEVVRREQKYSRIFEGGHDMTYISSQDGKLLNVNKAGVEMLGFSSKEEMLALDSVSRFYANPKDRTRLIALLRRDGSVKDVEFNWVRADGKPIYVLVSSRSYKDPKTGEVQYEGIIKDITRRKEIEELIQKRNRELFILNGIALAINYTMGLDNILQVTLKRILSGFSLTQGGVFLIDRTDKKTKLGTGLGPPGVEKGRSVELFFKDVLLRESLIERASRLSLEAFFPSFQAYYNGGDGNFPLWLSCHLIISKGQPVGFFGFVLPPGRTLDHQENRLLGSLGNFLGNAIENVRMIETIHQNRQDLQRLTEKLFQTQEDDRRRLARELHDEAG
jgi:PAS domain S-box-containing protein